uniref:Uncharacterized protein n=1 Tax=Oryza brachyantha TaxID=4533 RepID=J3M589_ORYBR
MALRTGSQETLEVLHVLTTSRNGAEAGAAKVESALRRVNNEVVERAPRLEDAKLLMHQREDSLARCEATQAQREQTLSSAEKAVHARGEALAKLARREAVAQKAEEQLARRRKVVTEREQRQLEAPRERRAEEDLRRQDIEVREREVGDLERRAQESDTQERALLQTPRRVAWVPGSPLATPSSADLEGVLLEHEVTIETLQLKLETGRSIIAPFIERLEKAARVAGVIGLTSDNCPKGA